MRPLLITGPDSTLNDSYELAAEIWPHRTIKKLKIPSHDYYYFDLSALDSYPSTDWDITLSVNEFYINDVRRKLKEQIATKGYKFTSLISPKAHISSSAIIGNNLIAHAGCYISSDCQIGDFCWLRPNVFLAENVTIENFVTLESNVSVREFSIVQDMVTICSGSSLLRGTKIGKSSYLNLSKQYSGTIPAATFFSPMFQEPIQVIGI